MNQETKVARHYRLKEELKDHFDQLEVVIICGDTVLEIDGLRIIKFDGMTTEGAKVREWWARQWRAAEVDDGTAE